LELREEGSSNERLPSGVAMLLLQKKGHRRFDCPTLRAKTAGARKSTTTVPSVAAVAESAMEESASRVVATVERDEERQLKVDRPFVRITHLKDKNWDLLALVDTGSPVSFIKANIFRDLLAFFEPQYITGRC